MRPYTFHLFDQKLRNLVLAGLPPAWLYKHPRRSYVEQVILATPAWVSHRDMLELHQEKKRKTEETGVEHVLDHVIPLNHPDVCGLNVPWNLQAITRAQNAFKTNRWHPDQMGLFDEYP